jgi:hypothetical protein
MSINNPDLDPANNYSLVGSINFAFQKMMQAMNGMLPAIVTAYDRETNRVSAQLAINLVTTDGQQVPRPNLVNIPVLILGGGTFSISFPVQVGDLGWVLASDRDISLFLQTYLQTSPNTSRMNNFADSLFIPDLMKSYNISSSNEDYFVIQSTDGTMSIEMGINPTTGHKEINLTADRININTTGGTGYLVLNGNLWTSALVENAASAVFTVNPTPPP